MVKGVAVASEPEDFRSASAVAGMREAASAATPVSVTGGLTKKSTPFVLPPLLTQHAPVGHAACTSFQRVSPWLNVHFAHSDTALKRLISQPPLFLSPR